MKNLSFIKEKPFIICVICTIISIIFFTWFSNICGLRGTFNWHLEILAIYRVLIATLFIPAIFFLLYYFKKNKVTTIVSYVFSILIAVIWIGTFCALTAIAHTKIDNSKLNIFDINQTLPYNKNPTEGEPIAHYAFASDPHWGSSKSDSKARIKIMDAIDQGDYDLFFCLGDVVDYGIVASQFKEAVKDMGDHIVNKQFRAIPGNHDSIVNGLPLFKSIFMDKKDKYYFRLDGGQIHLLFINMLWDSTEFTKKQEKWLIKQLEEIPQEDTVIVLSHCYTLSSGYYDPMAKKNWGDLPDVIKRLCPILEKYNVDADLSGHDHFFEYLEKDNVPYVVLGTMGGALDQDLVYSSPYSKYLDNKSFGWIDLKIYDSYMDVAFLNQDGETLFTKSIKTK